MPELNTIRPHANQLFIAPVLQRHSLNSLFLLAALHFNIAQVGLDIDSPSCIQFFDTLKTKYASHFEWDTLFRIHFPNKRLLVAEEEAIKKQFIEEYAKEIDFLSSTSPFVAIECFFCVKQNLVTPLVNIIKKCHTIVGYRNENGRTLLQEALLLRHFHLVETLLNTNVLPKELQNTFKQQMSNTAALYEKSASFRKAVEHFTMYCGRGADPHKQFFQIDAKLSHLLSKPQLEEEKINRLTTLQKEILENDTKAQQRKQEALANRKAQLAEREKWRKEQDLLWKKDYRSPTLAESIYLFFKPLVSSILSPLTSLVCSEKNSGTNKLN